ncbi:MAG: malonic semialdehyde reductase [Rhodocyclaceae bacterium]|nr:malonic semialdehyde reductase [Rhodocyclaceae bacterium]MDZ4214189.1 malonic semialdehyde reductase [Rhodocyclaceae bacterium]
MPIDASVLDQLFCNARTHNGWLNKPVANSLLGELHDLMKWGPTSANCWPLRVVYVKSPQAKARLLPLMMEANRAKTEAAPVTAILGMDLDFPDTLPKLFPHTDAKSWFTGNDALIDTTAFRNSSLQGAYFMLAARALGLDCGPMSGFDTAKVDAEFFAGTRIKSNFICNLGYGDPAQLFPRSPRPAFNEVCKII